MAGLLPHVDPDGLLEYSVVFTDRSLNHMSQDFQGVMNDISRTLQHTYNADAVVVVPGGGTFGMEAVARQFAQNQTCLVIRNGFFSYRWSQIFEMAALPTREIVMKARRLSDDAQAPFAPAPLEEVVAAIHAEKPALVFAPHVETASGMMLPDDYITAVANTVHAVGGLFVLDCIASGAVWVDMKACGVDILISAPQKGWSASPCAAFVMMNQQALAQLEHTSSNSFACDLKKWHSIMKAYVQGGHAYHATLPTDALTTFRNAMLETEQYGLAQAKADQLTLGKAVRTLLEEHGFASVAAPGFQAPGVVVSYTHEATLQNGRRFAELGLQTAAGVPLMVDEPADFKSFRLGLFGLDKLQHIERTIDNLRSALEQL